MKWALAMVLAAGCAQAAPPSPAPILRAYARAISAGDAQAAYPLLSRATRARLSERDFAARFETTSEERRAEAEAIDAALAPAPAPAPTFTARVDSPAGTTLLHRDPDGWRLVQPRPIDLGADTPEELLARVTRALQAHDADALLALCAAPLQQALEQALSARLSALRPLLGKPLGHGPERAQVLYGDHYHIELVKENGQWRIADFN